MKKPDVSVRLYFKWILCFYFSCFSLCIRADVSFICFISASSYSSSIDIGSFFISEAVSGVFFEELLE